MKRRRVFQVVVEYDTEHDKAGKPYQRWPNPGFTNPPINPDYEVSVENIEFALKYQDEGMACDWFATVEVTEENGEG